jgi:pimeloyl-ACP methyl ester carboxylesterase
VPAIFVRGVPDTERVWRGVLSRLDRTDVEAPADARETAARVDDTMERCILLLHRSAVTVGAERSADLGRLTVPDLVLWSELDPYAALIWSERLAARTGARLAPLAGCHHWWPLERPAEVAAALTTHWEGLGR